MCFILSILMYLNIFGEKQPSTFFIQKTLNKIQNVFNHHQAPFW